VVPPVLVPSVPATLPSHLLHDVVTPLIPPALPLPAGLRAPSHSARAPLACKDPFALPLRLGAAPSPGAVPHDAPLPYSAMAPLPAAPAAAGSEEEDVVVPPRHHRSRRAGASARASAVVPGHGPAVAAAGRAPFMVVVINNDDDNDLCSCPGAVLCRSPPASLASRVSVLRCRVPLWLPAGTPLPAPDSQGQEEVGGVVLHGR
jgi:hypothetical protein